MFVEFYGLFLCFIVDYGPGDWGKVAPPCSGPSQSPINIVSSLAEVNTTHNDLVVNFDNMDGTVTGYLINNGHAPKVFVDNNQGGATVTGAGTEHVCIATVSLSLRL